MKQATLMTGHSFSFFFNFNMYHLYNCVAGIFYVNHNYFKLQVQIEFGFCEKLILTKSKNTSILLHFIRNILAQVNFFL